MDYSQAVCARRRSEIVSLEQGRAQPATGRLPGQRAPGGTTADNDDIEVL